MNRPVMLVCFAVAMTPAAVAARPTPSSPPEVFTRVTACQSIADPSGRLACFDREVAAFARAEAAEQVVVVDQEQIRQTRRGLFGLSLPNIGSVFSHEEGLREITTKVAGASINSMGRWRLTLEDGSVWDQSETGILSREPRSGMEIRIRQAAMGSYLANIGGQRAIRVSRRR